MAKVALVSAKYIIKAKFEVEGIIEKPDVIGAIFGQTEGLLGYELDLRELQKSGRLGRIEVTTKTEGSKTVGIMEIPLSLNKEETALLAATIETVDRIGPYHAKVEITSIEDVRTQKRKYIVERAKELLSKIVESSNMDIQEISEVLRQAVREKELIEYGPEKLPAGPAIDNSDAIIIVEGRADVINLLRHGIKNVIALEGVKVPKTIIELSKKKTATAFLDGDRGGDLILKELLKVAEIDYVARAPEGKEVEELTKKEIIKALRNKVSVEQILQDVKEKPKRKSKLQELYEKAKNLNVAYLLNEKREVVGEIPTRELEKVLEDLSMPVRYLVFSGRASQSLVNLARERGVKYIVCSKKGAIDNRSIKIIEEMKDVRHAKASENA